MSRYSDDQIKKVETLAEFEARLAELQAQIKGQDIERLGLKHPG